MLWTVFDNIDKLKNSNLGTRLFVPKSGNHWDVWAVLGPSRSRSNGFGEVIMKGGLNATWGLWEGGVVNPTVCSEESPGWGCEEV